MNLGFGAAGMGIVILCAACSGTEPTPTTAPPRGDPIGRYEPQSRIDFDNVVSYGDAPTLRLPDPPKSGFRLVVPPMDLEPGDEIEDCRAWAYPNIEHKNVYAARIHTSGSLHHSNMYGVAIPASGPSPYPGCSQAQIDAFSVPDLVNVIDVLFANSTQIEGGEQIVFKPGMAFELTTENREVTTNIHWLNPSSQRVRSEIVYDFYTMPDELVEVELAPLMFQNHGFELAARSEGKITTTCDIGGTGHIATVMPHTHKRAIAFEAELVRPDGSTEPFFRDGGFDGESEITVFDEPVSLEGFTRIRHTCTVNNDLDRPIVWGVGENEMCTLFGYMYPPEAQYIGGVPARTAPAVQPDCISIPIGRFRK
jgi:hypothetical protein